MSSNAMISVVTRKGKLYPHGGRRICDRGWHFPAPAEGERQIVQAAVVKSTPTVRRLIARGTLLRADEKLTIEVTAKGKRVMNIHGKVVGSKTVTVDRTSTVLALVATGQLVEKKASK